MARTVLMHLLRGKVESLCRRGAEVRDRLRYLGLSRQRAALRFVGLRNAAQTALAPARTPVFRAADAALGPGVNLYGYLHGQFGLGQSARQYARALLQARYPVGLHDAGIAIPHACDDRSLVPFMGGAATQPINLVFVNPDHFAQVRPALPAAAYTIGFWFWELDSIPVDWMQALDQVDEVWVATAFVERAFRRATDKPVIRIPHPIPQALELALPRSCFDLHEDAFVFLCSFDFNSSIHRKNPFAVIAAFKSAFPDPQARVQLLIKTSNGHRHPALLAELLRHAQADARVLVRDQVLNDAQLCALQRSVDAYVSLHRAEGLGLGLAETMALGKPVIATAWSGNLDFMDDENSCLVPFRLVPVQPGQYPHVQDAKWAEADTEAAAGWMARLAGSSDLARDKGQRARKTISTLMSADAAAAAMLARLRFLQTEYHIQ
ncbi:glycosyltransferase [Pseudoxanthomonas winnipegensis]|uniref:glycosyltransferase n=1 Tax=Pseudoxanthomonas winnipegensis TaxID=2480810 RepID=UPI0030F45749